MWFLKDTMDMFVKVNISVQIFKDEVWLSMLFIKLRSYRSYRIIDTGTKRMYLFIGDAK